MVVHVLVKRKVAKSNHAAGSDNVFSEVYDFLLTSKVGRFWSLAEEVDADPFSELLDRKTKYAQKNDKNHEI